MALSQGRFSRNSKSLSHEVPNIQPSSESEKDKLTDFQCSTESCYLHYSTSLLNLFFQLKIAEDKIPVNPTFPLDPH